MLLVICMLLFFVSKNDGAALEVDGDDSEGQADSADFFFADFGVVSSCWGGERRQLQGKK